MKRTFEGYPSGFVSLHIVPRGYEPEEFEAAYMRQVERVMNGLRARNAIFTRADPGDIALDSNVTNPVIVHPVDESALIPVLYTNKGFVLSLVPAKTATHLHVEDHHVLYSTPGNEKWDVVTLQGDFSITEFLKKIGH